ncbi:hypothetical protein M0802_011923 [Mischocyttarus mexicanus]|nr:hypothetical protein M0802_011923 [Mischocyttarus mexicanus]
MIHVGKFVSLKDLAHLRASRIRGGVVLERLRRLHPCSFESSSSSFLSLKQISEWNGTEIQSNKERNCGKIRPASVR